MKATHNLQRPEYLGGIVVRNKVLKATHNTPVPELRTGTVVRNKVLKATHNAALNNANAERVVRNKVLKATHNVGELIAPKKLLRIYVSVISQATKNGSFLLFFIQNESFFFLK